MSDTFIAGIHGDSQHFGRDMGIRLHRSYQTPGPPRTPGAIYLFIRIVGQDLGAQRAPRCTGSDTGSKSYGGLSEKNHEGIQILTRTVPLKPFFIGVFLCR